MDNLKGFWGLTVHPNKPLECAINSPFKLSMATLALNVPETAGRSSLIATVEDEDFVLCSLTPGLIENVELNHAFMDGDVVTFSIIGEASVTLTGYYIEDIEEGEYLEGEDGDEDEDSVLYGEDDENDDEEGDDDDEEEEESPHSLKRKAPEPKGNLIKKQGIESSSGKPQALKTEQQKKQQQQQKPKNEQKQPEKKLAQSSQDSKKTLGNGLIIEEVQIGQGSAAKNGNMVSVRYVGKLSNGKIFDSNTQGKPFQFKLGAKDVIAGWDQGIVGMQVGGERKLTIPPQLAYGSRGAPPDIPKNATLTFVVKLIGIKQK